MTVAVFDREERYALIADLEPEDYCWLCGIPWLGHRPPLAVGCPAMRVTGAVYADGAYAPKEIDRRRALALEREARDG